MTDITGQTIAGQYFVNTLLGQGGMAEVYKVWDRKRATSLAMKVLREDLAQDVVFLRRFGREARTLEKLQHPNIVRFYEFGQDGRLAFILLGYVEGISLRTLIFDRRSQGLTGAEILACMKPICSALSYAHTQGVVHCDIKPANIMIDTAGAVLVSDFGIAQMAEGTTMTMVGAGTVGYMAPEQIRGEMTSAQTDIYALGVVLYEMLSGGDRPFTGERATITGPTSEKVRWEQLELEPAPLPRRKGVTPELEQIVNRCLARNPADRYPDVLDLLNDLQVVIGVDDDVQTLVPATASVTHETPAAAAPPPLATAQSAPASLVVGARRIPGWIWAVGAAVILLGLLGSLLSWGAARVPPSNPTLPQQNQVSVGVAPTRAPPTNSPPTDVPPPTGIPASEVQAIQQAIIDFDREMRYLLETGDTSRMSTAAAGKALQDRYDAENVLRQGGDCIWKYDHRGISFSTIDMPTSTMASVNAVVDRDGTVYCHGVEYSSYAFVGPYDALFVVELSGGTWVVTDYKPLK